MANEYSVNHTDLKAVADAIRAKAESTGSLSFPNGFIEAVANLSGKPPYFKALEVIEYTPTADKDQLTLNHSLGVAPNFVLCLNKGQKIAHTNYWDWMLTTPFEYVHNAYGECYVYGYGCGPYASNGGAAAKTDFTDTRFCAKSTFDSKKLKAGVTYVYYVGVIEFE